MHWRESFFILIGDTGLSLACEIPYPGWRGEQGFKAHILALIEYVTEGSLIQSIERYSLKYTGVIDGKELSVKAKLEQLSGEGVSGREQCPPVYHVEFDQDDFLLFLADPVGVLRTLGYETESMDVTITSNRWSSKQKKWIRGSGINTRMPITVCCIIIADKSYCGEWHFA